MSIIQTAKAVSRQKDYVLSEDHAAPGASKQPVP